MAEEKAKKPLAIAVAVDQKNVKSVTVPKPTRAEIIEALVLKKYNQFVTEGKARAAKGKQLSDDLDKALLDHAKAHPDAVFDMMKVSYDRNSNLSLRVDLNIKKLPKPIRKLFNEWREWSEKNYQARACFNWEGTRAEMRQALLADPARVKVLSESQEVADTLAYIEKNLPQKLVLMY